jgi:hypothetical protein
MNPCPCCGYEVFDEPPGSYDICDICFWEDDEAQLRYPEMDWGPNKVSLIEAQKNYALFGASEERLIIHVRKALPTDKRDPEWRPIVVGKDNYETDIGGKYPVDMTTLYYWRKNYWRS